MARHNVRSVPFDTAARLDDIVEPEKERKKGEKEEGGRKTNETASRCFTKGFQMGVGNGGKGGRGKGDERRGGGRRRREGEWSEKEQEETTEKRGKTERKRREGDEREKEGRKEGGGNRKKKGRTKTEGERG